MDTHRHEWTTGIRMDAAIIVSPVPAGKFIRVLTSRARVILMQSGGFTLTVTRAGDVRTMPAENGDIFIIPEGAGYDYQPCRADAAHTLSAFRLRLLTPLDEFSAASDDDRLRVRNLLGHFTHLPGAVGPRLQSLVEHYAAESETPRLGQSEILQSVANTIFFETLRLAQAAGLPGSDLTGKNQAIVQGVRRYLADHLKDSFSLDDVGWALGLSGEHTGRVFKKETGRTIFQHLKQLRIEQAARLLARPRLKIHEIAAETGFSSHAHFSREFKKMVGISPDHYRDQRLESISLGDS